MSSGEPIRQCWLCKNFNVGSLWESQGPRCLAFPTGIPDEIFYNRYDHREVYPNDNGVQLQQLSVAELKTRPVFKGMSDDEIKMEINKILAVLICVKPHPENGDESS